MCEQYESLMDFLYRIRELEKTVERLAYEISLVKTKVYEIEQQILVQPL
jgi:vacuolar-type H+-ATPase subunit D/Vma8